MRVVHISTTDGTGGASRAARRLHGGLRHVGVESSMAVGQVTSGGDAVESISTAKGSPLSRLLAVERVSPKLTRLTGEVAFPFPSSRLFHRSQAFGHADLIHLHNLHGAYFDLRILPAWSRRRPLVWTLHDMWPFTGHCAYAFDCDRWNAPDGCGPCPLFQPSRRPLDDIPQPPWDNSGSGWRRKRSLYQRTSITVVSPSRWLLDLAQQSLFSHAPGVTFHHIPYGLDTSAFSPQPKAKAREALGLTDDEPVLLYSAASLSQERKGLRHLIDAVRSPALARHAPWLLTFGGGRGSALGVSKLRSLGTLSDPRLQALAYSAADVTVVPSLADNQPLVALESMACGTPVVGYEVGGIPEIIRQDETGLCAAPGDASALAGSVARLLEDRRLHAKLSTGARHYVRTQHDLVGQARIYADLYRECTESFRGQD